MRARRLGTAALAGLVLACALGSAGRARAQDGDKPRIPDLFDPNHRLTKPEPGQVKTIRFLTTDDFPPFHFTLPDGTLAGFDIDLARAICSDLQLACTMQARRFDTLVAQIKERKDDALIAAVANVRATRADLDFTAPYYTTPARFVAATGSPLQRLVPEALAGHRVGVEAGTAHEAFLRAFFPKAALVPYPDQAALRAALQGGKVEVIFGDGIAFALWLNGTDAKGCCAFRGGPYTEARFFGNGVSIAVAKGNVTLRRALDYELAQVVKNGTYADLYLKYFPIGFY